MAKRNRKKRNSGFGFLAFIILFLFGIIAYNRFELESERKEQKAKLAQLQVLYEEEQERTLQLEQEKAYRQTTKYIEDLAREKLGLVYEEEIIFEEQEKSD